MDGRCPNSLRRMSAALARAAAWPLLIGWAIFGCHSLPLPPFLAAESDQVPGVTPPAERVAQIRQLALQAANADPQEQQRVAAQLAEAIRNEDDPMIRMEIVRAMGTVDAPLADRVLRAAVEDPSPEVRITAAEVWGRCGGKDAVEVLGQLLGSDLDIDVRLAAVRALGQIAEPSAVAVLGRVLDDPDPALQYRAVQSLKELTGKDLGNDVGRWQQYVRGELPADALRPSLAERLRQWF